MMDFTYMLGRSTNFLYSNYDATGSTTMLQNGCSVHCTTQPGAKEGFGTLAFSLWLLCLTTSYSCPSISSVFWVTPRISRGVESVPGVWK